jgi:hypothetical protein
MSKLWFGQDLQPFPRNGEWNHRKHGGIQLNEKEQAAFIEKVKALAPKYRTKLLREA